MSKTISIRVDEEIFNKYTSINKEKFKIKFIDLIDKFYLISVNSCKQSVNSCKQQNVNKLYSDSFNPKKVQAQLKTSRYDENVSLDELLKGLEENEK